MADPEKRKLRFAMSVRHSHDAAVATVGSLTSHPHPFPLLGVYLFTLEVRVGHRATVATDLLNQILLRMTARV